MKIKLEEEEKKLLNSIGIKIDVEKNYSDDELEEILDDVYFNESTHVEEEPEIARKIARIADKIDEIYNNN